MKICKNGHEYFGGKKKCWECINIKRRKPSLPRADYYREAHLKNRDKRNEMARARVRNYIKKPEYVYKVYRQNAEKRLLEFQLSYSEFLEYWQLPCSYCEGEIATIGLDRIDNTQGYSKENVSPCCVVCNRMKRDLPLSE